MSIKNKKIVEKRRQRKKKHKKKGVKREKEEGESTKKGISLLKSLQSSLYLPKKLNNTLPFIIAFRLTLILITTS
jgi:hypothetical protein